MSSPADAVEFLVITGLSGAGRRTAAHTLEDQSWYVVDNLPPELMPELLRIARDRDFTRVAVVLDVRTRSAFQQLPAAFAELGEAGVVPTILFLEASDETIVKRQESVRRPVPLQGDDRLLDGIRRERELLGDLRARADVVIDTTGLNVHELADRVIATVVGDAAAGIGVTLISFGYKNGIPIDADMVLDLRFLPNPHWVPELRPQTGLAQSVSQYVLSQAATGPFLDGVVDMLGTILPGYEREGKQHLTMAFGCTGGKHRSTAVVEELAKRLRRQGLHVGVRHRDLGLE